MGYDPRIGRRWNLDPEPITGFSEYSALNNSPILFSDPLGNYSDPPGWYNKLKVYYTLAVSTLTGQDAQVVGDNFDRGMNNLASVRVKSWDQIKSDTKESAGNAYWSFWGTTNGVLKQLTFGAYSKSPEDFNLTDKQAEYFNTGTVVGQSAPLPTEGGGNLSPRVALSGSGGAVLKPVTNLEVKIATTVLANKANGQQQGNSEQSTSNNQQSEARNLLDEALQQQGLNSAPNGFKQKWSRGNYDYEVRIHGTDPNAPQGSNSAQNTVLRVARRLRGTDAHGQGYGWEYADDNNHWYPQKDLKANNNPQAANDTHIIL